jgi:signal transduction histidine kinase
MPSRSETRSEVGTFVSEVTLEQRIILARWVSIGAVLIVGNFLTRQPIRRGLFNLSVLGAALANLLMFFLVHRYRESILPHASYAIAISDISAITIGCLLSGGVHSDMRYLYLVAIVVSALRFDVTITVSIAAASALAFAAIGLSTTGADGAGYPSTEVWIFTFFLLVITVGAALLAALLVKAGHRIAATAARNEELVSELQETLRELKAAQSRVIQAEKEAAVVELAGATAHELYQPMTVAWGFVELLLKETPEDASQAKPLRFIAKNLSRMRDIVDRIGQITHYETQDYPGGIQIVDIARSSEPKTGGEGSG